MSSCIFCAIAAGEIPCAELAQDGRSFAFLDINPVRPGHALVVPKAHAARLEDASPQDAAAVIQMAQRIAPALAAATGSPDATLAIHNGRAAGQEVPHLHLHIIPRRPADGGGPVHALFGGPQKADMEQVHDLAIRVQRHLEASRPEAAGGATGAGAKASSPAGQRGP